MAEYVDLIEECGHRVLNIALATSLLAHFFTKDLEFVAWL